jgi:hypothetical protein
MTKSKSSISRQVAEKQLCECQLGNVLSTSSTVTRHGFANSYWASLAPYRLELMF